MTLIQLRLIIVSISIACVGLLSIQFYWFKSAYDLQSEALKKTVEQTLRQTVKEIEKQEIIEEFQFAQIDSSSSAVWAFKNSKISQNTEVDEEIFQSISGKQKTIFRKKPSGSKTTNISITYDFGDDTTHKEIRSLHLIADSISENGNFSLSVLLDSLNEIRHNIKGLPYRILEKNKVRKVNLNSYDSIFHAILLEKDINIKKDMYSMELVNEVRPREDFSEASTVNLFVRLFPNDLTSSKQFIRFILRDNTFYILKTMFLQIALSLLLIGIVISCFAVAIKTILKQRKLSELKNDFINNMTHELKTPISSIALAAEGLQKKTASEKVQQYSEIISEENKRLSKHVENILQIAAIDRDQLDLNLSSLHVHDLLETSLQRFKLPIEAIEAHLSASLDAKMDRIRGDKFHLLNVFSNLIDNAVKYHKDKLKISISTWNEDESLKVSIEDNGIGMSKEQLEHAFEKFYRAQSGNIHDVKGFGLGLAYVKAMLEAHHGSIEMTSELGKGTTVILTLALEIS